MGATGGYNRLVAIGPVAQGQGGSEGQRRRSLPQPPVAWQRAARTAALQRVGRGHQRSRRVGCSSLGGAGLRHCGAQHVWGRRLRRWRGLVLPKLRVAAQALHKGLDARTPAPPRRRWDVRPASCGVGSGGAWVGGDEATLSLRGAVASRCRGPGAVLRGDAGWVGLCRGRGAPPTLPRPQCCGSRALLSSIRGPIGLWWACFRMHRRPTAEEWAVMARGPWSLRDGAVSMS